MASSPADSPIPENCFAGPSHDAQMEALAERIHLLEQVIDNFPGGLLLFDRRLRLVFCNDQQKKLLELPDWLFESGPPSLEEIFRFNAGRGEYGPGNPEMIVAERMALVAQHRAHVFERSRPNGVRLEIRGVPLKGGGFVTTYLDVTEQRRAQAMVAHLAHHDLLTDLPNRVLLQDRIQQAIARARRGEMFALHYIDLDGFKPVNDMHGHAVGDDLLKAVAGRLRGAVRETDTVARVGGDEFMVVQVGISSGDDATVLARRIIASLSEPVPIAGMKVRIGASIGTALSPEDGVEMGQLQLKADRALYQSKLNGGGEHRFYSLEADILKLRLVRGQRVAEPAGAE